MPLFTRTRKQLVYDILLFWVFAGTFQAILTPELKNGFPHIHFLYFWIVHRGLIITMFYATFLYKMRPNLKSTLRSFITIQGYFIFALFINKLTGAQLFLFKFQTKCSFNTSCGLYWLFLNMLTALVFVWFVGYSDNCFILVQNKHQLVYINN
jgi:hypothetical integral membrane protein (TIGR02206 family)